MSKEKKEKKKGSCFGTILKVVLVIVIIFAALYVYMQWSEKREREASYSTDYWPTDGIALMLPEPEQEYGILHSKSETYLHVTTGHVSADDFTTYINECSDAGYTIDYYQSSRMYDAENEEGYSVTLNYDEDDKEMSITLNAPKEPETENNEATTESSNPTAVETETQTEAAVAETESSEELVDGMRPEFKEAMDEYEEFFDEYVEFMQTYSESDNIVTLATQYAKFMTQYSETMEAFEAWEDEDLNDVEAAYYVEVSARITQKLLTVSAE
ncbi:MAG: hypothetical protein LUI14_14510 [Lachnospiraceae bacterium]|nr:hypothetical protein [Lachnospiraceae bacterium]